jgi:outer membrane receptor protein involved in Fe transport
MVYGLISEGYRAGGFNAGGIAAPVASRTVFVPDHLMNFEFGAKAKQLVSGVEFRTALFCDLWTNIQTDQYLNSGLSYTANVGDARILGWESDVAMRPFEGVTLQLNSLFDGAQVVRVNPNFAAHVSSGLPGVPNISFGGLGSYQRPLAEGLDFAFIGEISYIGRSRLTFDPTQSPSMGGYVDGKLSAQVKSANWRSALVLTNPANIAGDTFAFGNPFSFGQVRQVTPLRPRTLTLILSAFF